MPATDVAIAQRTIAGMARSYRRARAGIKSRPARRRR